MNRREKEKQAARRNTAREWAQEKSSGFEPTCIKLPEGVEFFKFDKAGIYKLDFMLYKVSDRKFSVSRADEGQLHFEREYEAHGLQTPEGFRQYVCAAKTFGKKCAVCDWMRKEGISYGHELYAGTRNKTRHLWVVNDKPGNAKGPFKVFDTGHFNKGIGFGEQMKKAFASVDEYTAFADFEGGYTLSLTVDEQTMGKGKSYLAATRVDFLARKYSYPDDVIESIPCLDDCIILPDYKSLMTILEGGSADDEDQGQDDDPVPSRNGNGYGKVTVSARAPAPKKEEDDSPPPRKAASKPDPDDDEDEDNEDTLKGESYAKGDTVMYKGMECKVMKIRTDGSFNIETEDGDNLIVKAENLKKVNLKEVSPDDDPPVKSVKPRKPAEDEDELDDDLDSEDEEEAPRGKKRGK